MENQLQIVKLEPTYRLKNEGSLYVPSTDRKTLCIGDLTEWDGKMFKVFAVSGNGFLTLQNTRSNQVPASLVLTPEQAKGLVPLIKVIKND
jgi:hypothetical protein